MTNSRERFAAAMGCMERIQTYIRIQDRNDPRSSRQDSERISISGESGDNVNLVSHEMELQTVRSIMPASSSHARKNDILTIKDASFTFSPKGTPILKNINIEISRGTLTMIIGAIGSGKSSLLKAMLGELPSSKGFVFTNTSSIAFCSQTPLLPNSKLRELVLAGSSYDEVWYHAVLAACLLHHDIATFPDGEEIIIGSDGATLSGGQTEAEIGGLIYCFGNIDLLLVCKLILVRHWHAHYIPEKTYF